MLRGPIILLSEHVLISTCFLLEVKTMHCLSKSPYKFVDAHGVFIYLASVYIQNSFVLISFQYRFHVLLRSVRKQHEPLLLGLGW